MRYRRMPKHVRDKQVTVLIVENEALVSLELAVRMTEIGLRALIASDADEAIGLLDRHPEIGLLMTDIKMPAGSMDGVRLAHHVRDRWPPVKIIVVSGLWETELGELPSDSIFLAKPCEPDALTDALAHLINAGPQLLSPCGPT